MSLRVSATDFGQMLPEAPPGASSRSAWAAEAIRIPSMLPMTAAVPEADAAEAMFLEGFT
jgi:hypothetical protein